MGIPVMIIGESGSGKSASLRNFSREEVGIFNVASKPLPFRNSLASMNHADYISIEQGLARNSLKCYVIDDSQYLMAFEEMARAKENGYAKFTDMALNFYNLVKIVIDGTSPDTIVYFLHHAERADDGRLKAKTVGKMIDSKITLEGLFSIVMFTQVDKDGHWFVTQSDGFNTAKTPMGMFDSVLVENDLKMVDTTIREYYNFKESEDGEK